MIDTQKIIDFFKKLDPKQLAVIAAGVVIVGLILLAFTFIIPVLVFAAAIAIIGFLIYVVYKAIGGK